MSHHQSGGLRTWLGLGFVVCGVVGSVLVVESVQRCAAVAAVFDVFTRLVHQLVMIWKHVSYALVVVLPVHILCPAGWLWLRVVVTAPQQLGRLLCHVVKYATTYISHITAAAPSCKLVLQAGCC